MEKIYCKNAIYIHGTDEPEQHRLDALNKLTNESFVSFLKLQGKQTVCEIGSGLGILLQQISDTDGTIRLTGVDNSPEQIVQAKKLTRSYENIEYFERDATATNLPDDFFDVVYCRYLLEHVSDPVAVVKEMLRIAKPGAHIFAQENDLQYVIYYPAIRGHQEVIDEFCALQIELGGDPFIGRKLFDIFKKAGATEINLSFGEEIHTEKTPELYKSWLKNSRDIFLGAKERILRRGVINSAVFNTVIDQFNDRIGNPDGIALFLWNRIDGIKADG